MQRSSLRPENALTAGLIQREAIQLLVVAVGSAAALLFHSRAVNVVAAIVDLIALVLAVIAAFLAWRVGGRTAAVALYVVAAVAFGVLAVLNLGH
jgi:thiol:disulfide interchange protein